MDEPNQACTLPRKHHKETLMQFQQQQNLLQAPCIYANLVISFKTDFLPLLHWPRSQNKKQILSSSKNEILPRR